MFASRRSGCRTSTFVWRGHEVVVLENRDLRVAVLPGLGADIVEFVHKPTDTDFLWRSQWPRLPFGAPPPTNGSSGAQFLTRYAGGWQELFPLCGDAADVGGIEIGVHGEVHGLPWDWRVEADDEGVVSVTFSVTTRLSPFKLSRTMTVLADQPTLYLKERATNLSDCEVDFMWGHHPSFGAPFLQPGCRIYTDAQTVLTTSHHSSPAGRLAPDRRSAWPSAHTKSAEVVDLSLVLGPEAELHDWAYLTDFAEGWFAVSEPARGVGFACRWPARLFPYLLYWQNLRGAKEAPWYGRAYTIALEPHSTFPASFTSGAPLLRLAGGASLELEFLAAAYQHAGPVSHVDAEGRVS